MLYTSSSGEEVENVKILQTVRQTTDDILSEIINYRIKCNKHSFDADYCLLQDQV